MARPEPPPLLERLRVDIWLDVACLFKTRSEAQRACHGGKVEVEGQRAKPNRELKVGDRLTLSRPFGHKQQIIVRGLIDQHVPKADARALYEDVTPPPSPEEQAIRDLIRQTRQFPSPVAPDKRARRALRRIKESGG
jgi:ribosome-associated heat shock protein Hsp15